MAEKALEQPDKLEHEDKHTNREEKETHDSSDPHKKGSKNRSKPSEQKYFCENSKDCEEKFGFVGSKCSNGLCHVQKHCKNDRDCSHGFQCLPGLKTFLF